MSTEPKPYFIHHISPAEIRHIRRNVQGFHVGAPLAQSDPLYAIITEAVADYNRTHPQQPLTEPRFLRIIGDPSINAVYMPEPDALLLSRGIYALPRAMVKVIIAHELGHKQEYETVGVDKPRYDKDALIAAYAPNLYQTCQAAGFTQEEVDARLPGNTRYWRPSGEVNNAPGLIMDEINQQEAEHFRANTYERIKLAIRMWFSPSCNRAINTIHTKLPEALRELHEATAKASHGRELRADAAARETYGRKLPSETLARLTSEVEQPMRSPDDSLYPHPSLEERVEKLGCTLKAISTGGYTATCPQETTPLPTLPSTRLHRQQPAAR